MKTVIQNIDQLDILTKELIDKINPGTIVLLQGGLGVGKTTFVASFMKHLNYYDVSSPSYTLVNRYDSLPAVTHIDLYRLESSSDIDMLDLDYYIQENHDIVFIEWANRLDSFPYPAIIISISLQDNQDRTIVIQE